MRGFLSTRVHHTSDILISTNTRSNSDLKPEDFIIINIKTDTVISSGFKSVPFLEFLIDAYCMRPEVNAIGHFHPPAATILSRTHGDFPTDASENGITVGEVLRVNCRACSSRFAGLCSCIENQRSSYAGVNALIIKDDGIVILDQHLSGVIERAQNMERTAATSIGPPRGQ